MRFSYAKPGTRPPVMLAGAFTTPAWAPQEMEYVEKPSAEDSDVIQYEFYKDVSIPEGTWQYKFFLRDALWWVLDENADTGMDMK